MRAIAKQFMQLKSNRQGGLIAYIMAGDPHLEDTPAIVEALIKGGADFIELGLPFSDPIADGPTIQAASYRALKAGTTPKAVLEIAGTINDTVSQPVLIMTYFNPIYKMGIKEFFEGAKINNISGVIVPDLPIEEASEFKKQAEFYDIDTIFFVTPSTSENRINDTLKFSSGFLYLVSVFGVTGARQEIQDATLQMIHRVQRIVNEAIPIAVGFGISTPAHFQAIINAGADAGIVGSAIVKIIEAAHHNGSKMLEQLQTFCEKIKLGTT